MHNEIQMYSFYDKEGFRYDTPFFALGDLQARRHFVSVARNANSTVHQFIDQFELHHLATFNVEDGSVYFPKDKNPEFPIVIIGGKEIEILKRSGTLVSPSFDSE